MTKPTKEECQTALKVLSYFGEMAREVSKTTEQDTPHEWARGAEVWIELLSGDSEKIMQDYLEEWKAGHPDESFSGWKIVQFNRNGHTMRYVNRALVDGYGVGDRFLEGCMFEVLVDPDGKLTVRATEEVEHYLSSFNSSAKKWEEKILEYVVDAGDNLSLDTEEEGWDSSELHLTQDMSFYFEQGYVLLAGGKSNDNQGNQ